MRLRNRFARGDRRARGAASAGAMPQRAEAHQAEAPPIAEPFVLALSHARAPARRRWPLLLDLEWQGHRFAFGLQGAPFVAAVERLLAPWSLAEAPQRFRTLAAEAAAREAGLAELRIRDIATRAAFAPPDAVAVPVRLMQGGETLAEGAWYGESDFPLEAGAAAALLPEAAPAAPMRLHVSLALHIGRG